jgi:hypothetical protein
MLLASDGTVVDSGIGLNVTDGIDNIRSSLLQFVEIISASQQPGQSAITSVQSQFRLSVQKVSPFTGTEGTQAETSISVNKTFEAPSTALEQLQGKVSNTLTLVVDSKNQSDAEFQMTSMLIRSNLFGTSAASNFLSTPLSMLLSGQTCSSPPCVVEVVLQLSDSQYSGSDSSSSSRLHARLHKEDEYSEHQHSLSHATHHAKSKRAAVRLMNGLLDEQAVNGFGESVLSRRFWLDADGVPYKHKFHRSGSRSYSAAIESFRMETNSLERPPQQRNALSVMYTTVLQSMASMIPQSHSFAPIVTSLATTTSTTSGTLELFNVTCEDEVIEDVTYTCSDTGIEIVTSCNGSASLIQRQCPELSQRTVCNNIGADAVTGSECTAVRSTDTNVTCSCVISSTVGSYSVSYVAMLQSSLTTFISTYSSIATLSASSVARGWKVLVTLCLFMFIVVLAYLYAKYLDEESAKEKELGQTVTTYAGGIFVLDSLNRTIRAFLAVRPTAPPSLPLPLPRNKVLPISPTVDGESAGAGAGAGGENESELDGKVASLALSIAATKKKGTHQDGEHSKEPANSTNNQAPTTATPTASAAADTGKSIEEVHAASAKKVTGRQIAAHRREKARRRAELHAKLHAPKQGSAELKLVEASLPKIMHTAPLMEKIVSEVRTHHRWIGVAYHYSENFPRPLRVAALATNIVTLLFFQSVTYNLANPDDGQCETFDNVSACTSPTSQFATGQPKCSWDNTTQQCSFIEPDSEIKVILFVAVFSALLSTPVSMISHYVIKNILAAKTEDRDTSTSAAAMSTKSGAGGVGQPPQRSWLSFGTSGSKTDVTRGPDIPAASAITASNGNDNGNDNGSGGGGSSAAVGVIDSSSEAALASALDSQVVPAWASNNLTNNPSPTPNNAIVTTTTSRNNSNNSSSSSNARRRRTEANMFHQQSQREMSALCAAIKKHRLSLTDPKQRREFDRKFCCAVSVSVSVSVSVLPYIRV